jgi:hypothetical protein|tara:strand:+ start:2175 stop:2501 length:327 start_codon:yes stop_codon:yes gene_type:complete
MDAQLKSQLTLTISVKSAASRNNYGDITYGSASSISARVENKTETIETPEGLEKQISTVVITEDEIKLSSIVFLPGVSNSSDNNGFKPKVVEKFFDELGNVDYYRTEL